MKPPRITNAAGGRLISLGLLALVFQAGCFRSQPVKPLTTSPATMLWAWERPENLMWLDGNPDIGVAFLAQTLELTSNKVVVSQRRQPLKVSPKTYLIAVTRIESAKSSGDKPDLTETQQKLVVDAVVKTLELENVKAIQLDFDALVSERPFYTEVLKQLKASLPNKAPLSMTALASWCVGDRWMSSLPVDEIVPMIFEMGADDKRIRRFLADKNDWIEPRCRDSYGLAVYEQVGAELKAKRRKYYFNKRSWREADLRFVDYRSSK